MGRSLLLLLAGVLVFGFVTTRSVQAADVEGEARAHFQNGLELYKSERFEEASIEFNRAYELKPSYKILFNIAQAENELGHFALALDAYGHYLATGGADVPKDRVDQVKAEIARLNTLVGMVTMEGGKSGSAIIVDKESRGTLPLDGPLFLDVGKHEVAVETRGKRVFERVIKVAGGERATLKVAQEEQAEAPTAAAAPTPVIPREQKAPEQPKIKEHGLYWMWGWVATGTGAAFLAVGAITGGVALSMGSDLKDSCPGNVCAPSKQSDIDTMGALGTTSTVFLVAGGVVAATGVVLLILDATGEEKAQTVAVAPSGATWTWRF